MLRNTILGISVCLFGLRDAYAYIDPNVGGWLFQMLFPVLLALVAGWAVLRQKIARYLSALVKRFRAK